jgi:uncharacterized membrane protein YbhN (UPF0104 family)
MPPELAVASALLIRIGTLWFGVTVGFVMLLAVTRRLPGRQPVQFSRSVGE